MLCLPQATSHGLCGKCPRPGVTSSSPKDSILTWRCSHSLSGEGRAELPDQHWPQVTRGHDRVAGQGKSLPLVLSGGPR